ncbi:MAG: cytochrome oxidase assembly protein [Opitutaceae bacterium]|nr:cytochrome oxidase assembly protein [Opitutaceae bacterium]
MGAASNSLRTTAYKPALAWFAAFGSAWVFALVALGAFTTSIGAGMAFPDWPLSNGSLNPPGWLSNLAMFAEHSHRLSAGVMGTVTIVLAVWLWRTEVRAWLRQLAWFAVGLVLVQGVVGGLRVLFDRLQVPMVDTSLGRLFAMAHAVLAQIYVCTLLAIAIASSRAWLGPHTASPGASLRRAGVICCALLLGQLAVAAVMRHSFAGLAIPTFPSSTTEGGLLPEMWNFRVGLHFAHRVLAAVLALAVGWFAIKIWTDRAASLVMRCGASTLVSLVALQILLGAQIIWTNRAAMMTTGHVLVGALTLAITFWLTWFAHRDVVEARAAARH